MINAIQFQNKRVGSTFLQKAIDSHPSLAGIDEVFVNMARKPGMRKSGFVPFLRSDIKDVEEYIKEVIWKTYPDKHTIFKLMYNQIDFHAGMRRFIIENKIPIIHLMRKNLVKQVISGQNAANTSHKSIDLSPHKLMSLVRQAEVQNRKFASQFKDQIKLTLYYEDIIGNNNDRYNDRFTFMSESASIAVCEFFGVKYAPMYADTKKKNKKDVSVYLPNMDAIRKHFNCTIYDWMLEKNKTI